MIYLGCNIDGSTPDVLLVLNCSASWVLLLIFTSVIDLCLYLHFHPVYLG